MILTKEERRNLLAVKTTKKEARTMKMRFKCLLEALKKEKVRRVEIGCPHCETAHVRKNTHRLRYNCHECAYTKAAHDRGLCRLYPELGGDDFACVEHFSFGDVTYDMVNHLITLDRTNISLKETGESTEDIETFAKGHIEWAELVLKAKK